jgi:hypothetical protein
MSSAARPFRIRHMLQRGDLGMVARLRRARIAI